MNKIWINSDLHLGHQAEFIWRDRGFTSVQQMNDILINRHNEVVSDEDDVYLLGDIIMGNSGETIELFHKLKGRIHVIYGNHDESPLKHRLYQESPHVVETAYATMIKSGKWRFYLSHYPTLMNPCGRHSKLANVHGHDHAKFSFHDNLPHCYSCCVDSNNGYPRELTDIKNDIQIYLESKSEDGK